MNELRKKLEQKRNAILQQQNKTVVKEGEKKQKDLVDSTIRKKTEQQKKSFSSKS